MTTVYLIRHANAVGNQEGRFNGRIDQPLSELGNRQLEALATRCQEFGFDCIYSSPLQRAVETAQAANRAYGYEIYLDAGLLEISVGDWEGRRWKELLETDPEEFAKWKNWESTFQAPNGERLCDVYLRVRDTILRIVKENRNNTICIVSHGCAIANALAWAMQLPPERLGESILCGNTAISKVTFDDTLAPYLEWSNDDTHLSADLRGRTSHFGK